MAKGTYGVSITAEELERFRAAACHLEAETVSSLMVKGGLAYVAHLEAERGAPFPPREGEVKTGRPKKKIAPIG